MVRGVAQGLVKGAEVSASCGMVKVSLTLEAVSRTESTPRGGRVTTGLSLCNSRKTTMVTTFAPDVTHAMLLCCAVCMYVRDVSHDMEQSARHACKCIRQSPTHRVN